MTMQPPVITVQGKQVLFDGKHFADAATETGAEMIVAAMNTRPSIVDYLDREAERRKVSGLSRMLRAMSSNIRARLDEVDDGR
jgi:hypothetical protein